jgi:hypothetical protein
MKVTALAADSRAPMPSAMPLQRYRCAKNKGSDAANASQIRARWAAPQGHSRYCKALAETGVWPKQRGFFRLAWS